MSTATQPAVTAEFALGMREFFLQNLEKEMNTTSRVVQAIPAAKSSWRPDPKAKTALELAWHIVTVDVLFTEYIAKGSFEKMMEEEKELNSKIPKTPDEIVVYYKKNFPAAMERVRAMSPNQLLTPIDFMGAFKMPAFTYLSFINNHTIHHRGQLSTYLRPMGSKVPSIYGPSGDEEWKG